MVRESKTRSEHGKSSSRSSRKREFDNEEHKQRSYKDGWSCRSRRHSTHIIDEERDFYRRGGHKRRRTSGQDRNTADYTDRGQERIDKRVKEIDIADHASVSGPKKSSSVKEDEELNPTMDCGDGEGKKTRTYYRSNLRTAIKEINSVCFSDSKKKAIKKTPFWYLFEAMRVKRWEKLMHQCHKYEADILKIARTFDGKQDFFDIGGQKLEMTSTNAKLIFGIGCGDTVIPVKLEETGTPRWVKRVFQQQIREKKSQKVQFVLYKPQILRKIKDTIGYESEQSIDDMARMVHCYLLASFLSPSQNGSISGSVTEYAEDLSKICNYDWGLYIVDFLKAQLTASKHLYTGGCVNLITFWLCEHTKLVDPLGDLFPRFLKWDMPELHDELDEINLSTVGNVRKRIHSATNVEKDKFDRLKNFQAPVVGVERALVRFVDPNSNNIRKFYEGARLSDDEVVEPTADVYARVEAFVSGDCSDEEDASEPVDTAALEEPRGFHDTQVGFEEHFDASEPADTVGLEEQKVDDIVEPTGECRDKMSCGDEAAQSCKDGIEFSASQFFKMDFDHSTISKNNVDGVIGRVIGDLSLHGKGCFLDGGVYNGNGDDHMNEDVGGNFDVYNKTYEGRVVDNDVFSKKVEKTPNKESSIIAMMTEEMEGLSALMESSSLAFDKDLKARDEQIILLQNEKMDMMKEMDKIRIQMEGDRADFAANLKVRAEKIRILTREKMELSQKLEEMAIPSATQVYDNPQNLAYLDALERNAILTKENEDLKAGKDYMMKSGEAESSKARDLVLKTPTDKGKGVAIEQEQNTLIKCVKGRTARDERKRVEISPQLPTNELVKIHEPIVAVALSDIEGGVKDSHPMIETVKLDYSFTAVKKADADVIISVEKLLRSRDKNYYVWEGEEPLALVTLEHIIKILHHGRIDSDVIDAWGDMVHFKNEELFPKSKYTLVFSASCWGLINGSRSANLINLDCLVDKQLEVAIEKDILLFPIRAEGSGGGMGDHWTLLRLNRHKSEWKFYNSISHGDPRSVDPHLTKSFSVVKYVDNKLRKLYRKRSATHSLLQKKLVLPKSETCVQQLPHSVDSGVVVCHLIEKFMLGQRPNSGTFGLLASGSHRARMVKDFIQTKSMEVKLDR